MNCKPLSSVTLLKPNYSVGCLLYCNELAQLSHEYVAVLQVYSKLHKVAMTIRTHKGHSSSQIRNLVGNFTLSNYILVIRYILKNSYPK